MLLHHVACDISDHNMVRACSSTSVRTTCHEQWLASDPVDQSSTSRHTKTSVAGVESSRVHGPVWILSIHRHSRTKQTSNIKTRQNTINNMANKNPRRKRNSPECSYGNKTGRAMQTGHGQADGSKKRRSPKQYRGSSQPRAKRS